MSVGPGRLSRTGDSSSSSTSASPMNHICGTSGQDLTSSSSSSGGERSVPTHQPHQASLRENLLFWGQPQALEVGTSRARNQEWPAAADTVTIKNIPCRCRAQEILSAVKLLGFEEKDLVYLHLPVKQGRSACNLGYCFLSFRSPELARDFFDISPSFRFPERQSRKVPQVEAARIPANRTHGASFMHGEVLWFGRGDARAEGRSPRGAVATVRDNAAGGAMAPAAQLPGQRRQTQALDPSPQPTSWLL